uniref:Heat shock 70 kDa protein 12A n=1 Tax=Magallana gigas TaxID=29159 RepID=K1PS94_MAGGI
MDDIHFVLTVPAIWDDTAKMFMREAAVDAGIKSDQLLIALEPEAASIYCQLMHLEANENKRFFLVGKEIGAKYMVIDLGGGTADITIHQLKEDGSLAELVPASGGSWGGTCIDKALNDFLTKVFGETVMKIFKTDPEYLEDYFEFWHRFEVKKRNFETKSNKNDGQNCSVIQDAVKKEFEGKCGVVVPNQAGLAVVKGAVYFGHQPDLITERVSRYTYGIQTWPAFNETKHDKSKRVVMADGPRCRDVFFKFVVKGDKIKPGDKKAYIFKYPGLKSDSFDCGVFISNEKNPKYVDDEGCAKLGTLHIPLDGVDRNADIEETLIFGDTELHVTACNCTNKMKYKVTFDLLSENINFS